MNKKTPSIKLNMLMSALLTLSSIIFPLITLPYVTRVLGPEGVGKVYFGTSVVTFFSMFAELGIPVYGIRACARVRDDKAELSRTVHEIMAINLVTCLISYAGLALSIITVPKLADDRTLIIIMSALILLNALGAEWLYKAIEKYTYITVRSLLFKLIALAAMFMLVREKSDYIIYGGITIFAASASNILNFINLRRHISLRPAGGYRFARHLPAMLMFFALAIATSIYINLDLAILGFMKGDTEAGLYGVSVKIKLVLVSLITSVSSVLLPRNSYYYDRGRTKEFTALLSTTMNAVITVSAAVVLYFIVYAGDCIELLAGRSFEGSVSSMKIIMPAVIFIGISNIIGMQMLVPQGREKETVIAAVIGAAVDLILNFILIPRFASAGAAAATLAAEICVTGYMIYAAGRESGKLFAGISYAGITAALAAAYAASLPARAVSSVFLRLVTTAVCFFGVYMTVIIIIWRKNGLLHRD